MLGRAHEKEGSCIHLQVDALAEELDVHLSVSQAGGSGVQSVHEHRTSAQSEHVEVFTNDGGEDYGAL